MNIEEFDYPISVNNPDDRLEVAIKSKLSVGEVFSNGWNEVYRRIGLDNLGISSLDGGKQKARAKKLISQYANFELENNSKRAIRCTSIFEIPQYIESTDRRGKNGFYIDRIIPILVDYLRKTDQNPTFTSVTALAKVAGLINENYNKLMEMKRTEGEWEYSPYMISQFLVRCKSELRLIIFRALHHMQNEYQAIRYNNRYCIITENGKHLSLSEEEKLIEDTQAHVLKEFNVDKLGGIFMKRLDKKFYKRVCDVISDVEGVQWIEYYPQIEINIHYGYFYQLAEKIDKARIDRLALKQELRQHFSQQILEKTRYDIRYTEKKEARWIMEAIENLRNIPENSALFASNLWTDESLTEFYKLKNPAFKYPKDYAEIQDELRILVIGKTADEEKRSMLAQEL